MNDASAEGINNGTECAVSEAERINNLLEMARQVQTDVRPSQYTPLKRACVEIDRLRRKVTSRNQLIDEIQTDNERLTRELALLCRPWWVKLIAWFASSAP